LVYNSGAFYGTTNLGGSATIGTIFKIDAATNTESVLHSFARGADGANPDGDLLYHGNLFYGITAAGGATSSGCNGGYGCGTVFSLDPVSGAETTLFRFASRKNGDIPHGNLVFQSGYLYGTTFQGGTNCKRFGCGTIYRVKISNDAEKVLVSFAEEAYPTVPLILQDGIFYGTTESGGTPGWGSLFSFTP
jgi:uncharacterized repeat protein (TIGR03803 family)